MYSPRHAVEENLKCQVLDASRPGIRQVLDPFGIMTSCLEVQQAWLRQPGELAKQLFKLAEQCSNLQILGYRRFCGQGVEDTVRPVAYDERFAEPIWTEHPYYDLMKESYLAYSRWLEDAIEKTPDVAPRIKQKAGFWVRQMLNAASPSNYFWTNPHAVHKSIASFGMSTVDGLRNAVNDAFRGDVSMVDDETFKVGHNLAATPGQVVFRNHLLEVIQYAPATQNVHNLPVVIVTPWINKYYILDLSAKKSLVHYLASRGFSVFITSWNNPHSESRNVGFEDYMLQGALQAVDVAREVTGAAQVHAVGYCIGGTILAALMAWLNTGLKRNQPPAIAHFTLLAALVDFTAPGDIGVFIDENSIAFLDKLMAAPGYLDGAAMAWSFRMLRSNSLIWHYVVHNYLYGEGPPPLDVLYWNTDTTRLPAAMHSYYLRECYLNNKLVQPGGLTLGGKPIDLRSIKQPLYAVGTEKDHISPWKETFKICALVQAPVRYVLATSGHIMGVVNPPVEPPKRRYWVGAVSDHADPETWRNGIEKTPGSWWEDWAQWLGKHCGPLVAAPPIGSQNHPALCPAPGTYVLER